MADVPVTITIPEEHVPKVIAAFTALSGRQVELNAPGGQLGGNHAFVIPERVEGETLLNFGKRTFLMLGRAVVRLYADVKFNVDTVEAKAAAIAVVEREEVLDEILE